MKPTKHQPTSASGSLPASSVAVAPPARTRLHVAETDVNHVATNAQTPKKTSVPAQSSSPARARAREGRKKRREFQALEVASGAADHLPPQASLRELATAVESGDQTAGVALLMRLGIAKAATRRTNREPGSTRSFASFCHGIDQDFEFEVF